METVAVNSGVNDVHYVLDDLAESKRNDGQVVASQSQYGYTDEESQDPCQDSAANNCSRKSYAIGKPR